MKFALHYLLLSVLTLAPPIVRGQVFLEQSAALGINHYALDANMTAGGVVIFDYNNDGFEDIFFTGGELPAKLYRNNSDGSFTNVTQQTGLANLLNQVHTVGGVAGDVNNDGYRDLLVTTSRDFPCILLLNMSGEGFEDVSRRAGFTQESWSTSATMADYDLDGDLDLYVANYVTYEAPPFEANITGAEADFFYRNTGDGRFEKIKSPTDKPGCTLAAFFSDYDRDGDSDLFLLNDFGDFYQPNQLYRNDRPSGFTEVSERSGMRAAINSMGIAVGDINYDTYPDYYVSNIGNNLFYLNQGNGELANVTDDYTVNDGKGFSWGAAFLDIDNDADLDLFVGKGSTLSAFDPQYNRLYRNVGDGDFEDVSVPERIDNQDRARGVATGDLNNDGLIDLVVACVRVEEENTGRAMVYINQGEASGGSWLSIQLQGTTSNRDAVGSVVTAYVGGKPLVREVSAGNSYLSSHSAVVHIGLGETDLLDSLTVHWSGGDGQTFRLLPTNTSYRAVQGQNLLILQRHTTLSCDEPTPGSIGIRYDTLAGASGLDTLKMFTVIASENHGDCVLSSNETLPDSGILIYPNPFTEAITVQNQRIAARRCQVRLLNYLGQELDSQEINLTPQHKQVIRFEAGLPPGGYLIELRYGSERTVRKIWKTSK